MEGQEEVGEGRRGARQPVKKSIHVQSEFLGQKFGQIGKNKSGILQPRKFILVGRLQLIRAVHKLKWT
jgi:hypothetical protein